MAKKKKVKLIDKLLASIRKKWEDASIRDIAYLTSYVAAVAISYKIIQLGKGIIVDFFEYDWINLLLGTGQYSLQDVDRDKIDMEVLLTSCVAAYMILKADMEDVTSAVSKITTVAASFG